MLIALFVVLVAASLVALARVVQLSRSATADAVQSVTMYGYRGAAVLDTSTARPQNLALEKVLARLARRLSPADYESRLRLRLLQAGLYQTRVSRFMAIRLVVVGLFAALGLLYFGNFAGLAGKAAAFAMPYLGWMLPEMLLSARIRRRQRDIERSSADLIDLLAITVQAGLGLDQAVKVAAQRMDGPLAEECRLMVNEVRVGQSREQALRRMAERADTPTIRSFTRTMAQGESLGVSIADILRALAVDARSRKKLAAEEQAQKAPIKMLAPLASCFFPAILIVTAGPGLLGIIDLLGG